MKSNHKCGGIEADNLLYLSDKLDNNELTTQIRNLKRQLRGVMNGVASSSMQERGLNYKVNYGVPFVILKQMATSIPQNHELAQLMWAENVRELNILATFVQPQESFNERLAEEWIKRIKNVEQCEYISLNLLQQTSFALTLALQCLQTSEVELTRYTAWLLLARISKKNQFTRNEIDSIFVQAISDLSGHSHLLTNGAILTLKKVGATQTSTSTEIINLVNQITFENEMKKEQLIEDLRFEFEYYAQSSL